MREPAFLRKNKEKWQEYEHTLFHGDWQDIDPDRLADLYIQLTDDLAYARTFYPKSQTVRYLNGLAARTHLAIYKNKKEKRNRFLTFWSQELPLVYRRAHRPMFYSFVIFTFAFLIGMLAALKEPAFLRMVLGDGYVDMTLENIENGDPMGVYKQMPSLSMFVYIARNNIQVAFNTFAWGILTPLGTIYFLFYNGIMLGGFLTFFHTQNLIWETLPVIYVHGTLELTAIVIAGGAGILLGNSFLFPGTYTRKQSLQRAAKDGIKIMVGLVPVFITAAFLESYVTRLTETPLYFKLCIIILSLAFLIWYYILYPIFVERQQHSLPETTKA
ncbi:MAG: stage II sporulation protein M [Bacteroidota bacterium]